VPAAESPSPSADSLPRGGPALIAGYRVLRRLGSGDRADLYVGVAPARTDPPGPEVHGPEPSAAPTAVVLKVFHPGTEDLSVEREVRALSTLTPGRLTTLFDVGTLPDGRTCLVLEQLTGGALSGILAVRRHIHPGEAVTILAPVASALAELHTIGLMHPAVSLSNILFDSSGRPVLTGLGELRALPAAGRGRPEAFDIVHGRLAQVVRAVLDQVDPGDPAPTARRDLDRWCAVPDARSAARAPGELEHLLFSWAEAAPVRLGQARAVGGGPQPSGDWFRRPPADDPAVLEHVGTVHTVAGESRAGRIVDGLVSRARAVAGRLRESHPVAALTALLPSGIRFRRGPLVLAALLAMVTAGLALTALGQGGSPDSAGARPAASPEPAEASGNPSAEPAEPTRADTDGAAVTGDDPVTAVPALLRIRTRCLDEVSVVCLDGVHQSQSAALAADSHVLRLFQQGGGAPEREDLSSWAANLVERTGDVALVSLQAPDAERQPASVLVVKGEAGWRIRDVFDY
jgi:hypothetical protein